MTGVYFRKKGSRRERKNKGERGREERKREAGGREFIVEEVFPHLPVR